MAPGRTTASSSSSSSSTPKRRLDPKEYTVAWMCALPVEFTASRALLEEVHEPPTQDSHEMNTYTLGRIHNYNVVMLCLPVGKTGTYSAAGHAQELVLKFPNIRFGLLVGIAGGVPSSSTDLRLGDVIISHASVNPPKRGVVQYDNGVALGGTFTPYKLPQLPKSIFDAVARLKATHEKAGAKPVAFGYLSGILSTLPTYSRQTAGTDVLFRPTARHVEGTFCNSCNKSEIITRTARPADQPFKIHYGTIGSGYSLMRDGVARDTLSGQLGGVLCFEMEASGVVYIFPCVVVRGVCDYADAHKNKNWQPYASATAAAAAREVLSILPATVTK